MAGSLVFMTVWWICTAGSDQMAVQRYLATRDTNAARHAFLTTLVANVVIMLTLAALGLALLGFFRAHPQPGLLTERDADKLFPYYIVRFLPPGITGLVLAGLLAAAMSSLSAGINASCSVIVEDFISRFRKRRQMALSVAYTDDAPSAVSNPAPPRAESTAAGVRETKVIAVITGLVVVGLSLLMGNVTGNILEVTVRTNHVFVAPLFGLFFMALFVRFATPLGAGLGAAAGCAAAVLTAYWDLITGRPALSFQWITLCSFVVNLAVGCLVSGIQTGGREQGGPGCASGDPSGKQGGQAT